MKIKIIQREVTRCEEYHKYAMKKEDNFELNPPLVKMDSIVCN